MANSCDKEHEQGASLNSSLQKKLGTTRALQEGLEGQLSAVQQEQVKASAQRDALTAALDAQKWVWETDTTLCTMSGNVPHSTCWMNWWPADVG